MIQADRHYLSRSSLDIPISGSCFITAREKSSTLSAQLSDGSRTLIILQDREIGLALQKTLSQIGINSRFLCAASTATEQSFFHQQFSRGEDNIFIVTRKALKSIEQALPYRLVFFDSPCTLQTFKRILSLCPDATSAALYWSPLDIRHYKHLSSDFTFSDESMQHCLNQLENEFKETKRVSKKKVQPNGCDLSFTLALRMLEHVRVIRTFGDWIEKGPRWGDRELLSDQSGIAHVKDKFRADYEEFLGQFLPEALDSRWKMVANELRESIHGAARKKHLKVLKLANTSETLLPQELFYLLDREIMTGDLKKEKIAGIDWVISKDSDPITDLEDLRNRPFSPAGRAILKDLLWPLYSMMREAAHWEQVEQLLLLNQEFRIKLYGHDHYLMDLSSQLLETDKLPGSSRELLRVVYGEDPKLPAYFRTFDYNDYSRRVQASVSLMQENSS